jgi:hypothetical protein
LCGARNSAPKFNALECSVFDVEKTAEGERPLLPTFCPEEL